MRGIDADLIELQPVAVDETLKGEGKFVRRLKAVEGGQRRRIARPHVGKNDAVAFYARVSPVLDLVVKIAVLGFCRLFQAFTRPIEQPAMKGTAKAAIFEPPIIKVGAAVRTVATNQPIGSIIAAI